MYKRQAVVFIAFDDADQTDLHVISAETGTEFLFSILNNILIHNIPVDVYKRQAITLVIPLIVRYITSTVVEKPLEQATGEIIRLGKMCIRDRSLTHVSKHPSRIRKENTL